MNKFFKKIAVVLALTMVFAAMPMSVFAATDVSDLNGLQDALTRNETEIKITTPIVISSEVTLTASSPVTITTNDVVDVFKVVEGGKLTLGNNVTVRSNTSILYGNGGTIVVDGANLESSSSRYNLACVDSGVLEINSGAVTGTGTTVTISTDKTGVTYIKGGTVSSAASTAVKAKEGGKVVVEGGTVESTGMADSTYGYCAIHAADGGVVEISGGTVKAVGAGFSVSVENTGKATVSGGSLLNGVKTQNTGAEALVISGGDIGGNVKVWSAYNTEDPAKTDTISISGGKFATDVTPFVVAGKVFDPATGVVGDPVTEAPAATTHEHVWGYNAQFDAAAHWDYCHVCGAQNTPAAHSNANGNGVCECGWVLTSAPSRVNPNTGVTAEMLK